MRSLFTSTKLLVVKSIILSVPVFILFSGLPEVYSQTGSLGNIMGCVVKNENIQKVDDSSEPKILGAFATTVEPTKLPISLNYEFSTFDKLYIGIVAINDSDEEKDVAVSFKIKGPISGKQTEEITLPPESTYIAYFQDIFSRTGFYTIKGKIESIGTVKITLLLNEQDTTATPTPIPTPTPTP